MELELRWTVCGHGEGVALIVVSSDFSDGHVRFTPANELGQHAATRA